MFVDVTHQLASPDSRKMVLVSMGQHDPRTKYALKTIIQRGDFIESLPNDKKGLSPSKRNEGVPSGDSQTQIENDTTIVSDLIKSNQTSIEELKQKIKTKSGSDLFDFILKDIQLLKKILFDPQSSAELLLLLTGKDITKCCCCKNGKMLKKDSFIPRNASPPIGDNKTA